MGFSISQANTALVATQPSNGKWSVQAALEVLMESSSSAQAQAQFGMEETGDSDDAEEGMPRFRRDYDDDDDADDAPPPRPSPLNAPATGRRAREAAAAAVDKDKDKDLQDTATELLAQASKIGFSVFKSANAYWETGRATIQKKIGDTLAEQASTSAGGGAGERVPGRPKWMTDDVHAFRDDNDGPRRSPPPPRPRPPPQKQQQHARPAPPPAEPTPAPYRSAHRRPPPKTASPAPAPDPQPTARRTPTPPRPSRPTIPVSSSALSSSLAQKTAGNAAFRLGQFALASESYSLALASLPPLSLPTLALLNNRSSARLHSGDASGAIEDSTKVIETILGPRGVVASRVDLAALDADSAGGVDLRDCLAKALGKRAKAYEVAERWATARDDYEVLRAHGDAFAKVAGGHQVVRDGLERCRKMLAPPPPRPAPSSAPPPPRPPPSSTQAKKVQGSGEAVAALRSQASAQASEDDLRLSLKDAIDFKIQAWKGGKEANLRALIASLDSVLWPELGWVKVGLHELVTDGQVKVRYVRAIAKLHPDKVRPSFSGSSLTQC